MSINSHLPAVRGPLLRSHPNGGSGDGVAARQAVSRATAKRACPFVLVLALFATAFTATIALRLVRSGVPVDPFRS